MTYFTKSRSPKGTRASMLLTEMQRSARSTSYICKLAHALARLFPERLGGGREVGVFVPEQLVGDLPRQQDAHVRDLVYLFADEVHADGGAHGGDVEGAGGGDDLIEGGEHLPARHDDLGMHRADVVRDLAGVLQVYRVPCPCRWQRSDRPLQDAEATAHTREESSPPERRKPTGASASSRLRMPSVSLMRILRQTASNPSAGTALPRRCRNRCGTCPYNSTFRAGRDGSPPPRARRGFSARSRRGRRRFRDSRSTAGGCRWGRARRYIRPFPRRRARARTRRRAMENIFSPYSR